MCFVMCIDAAVIFDLSFFFCVCATNVRLRIVDFIGGADKSIYGHHTGELAHLLRPTVPAGPMPLRVFGNIFLALRAAGSRVNSIMPIKD